MPHDFISKPSAGRYFPLSPKELITSVKEVGLSVLGEDERLSILIENCTVECEHGYQLCSFFQNSYVAMFSLPEDIPANLSRKAVLVALDSFKKIDGESPITHRDQEFIIYRAYLAPLGVVSIARHIVRGGHRWYLKYRDAAKLSKSNKEPEHQYFLGDINVIA